jgi:hypothetical protein
MVYRKPTVLQQGAPTLAFPASSAPPAAKKKYREPMVLPPAAKKKYREPMVLSSAAKKLYQNGVAGNNLPRYTVSYSAPLHLARSTCIFSVLYMPS